MFKQGKWARLTALAAAFLLLAACGKNDLQLLTQRQLLRQLRDAYQEDFVILSSEPAEGKDVIRGNYYQISPKGNPGFVFSAEDYIGSGYTLHTSYFHVYTDNYAELLFRKEMTGFLTAQGIPYTLESQDWNASHGQDMFQSLVIRLPAENMETHVRALAGFAQSVSETFPFDQKDVRLSCPKLVYQAGDVQIEKNWYFTAGWRGNLFAAEHISTTDPDTMIRVLTQEMQEQQSVYQFSRDFASFLDGSGLTCSAQPVTPEIGDSDFVFPVTPENLDETVNTVCAFLSSQPLDTYTWEEGRVGVHFTGRGNQRKYSFDPRQFPSGPQPAMLSYSIRVTLGWETGEPPVR